MASFRNLSRDEIPSATVITHLSPLRSEIKTPAWGTEAWCCAFSPDETFFAWSSGNSIVTLIPWKYCKSTLFNYPAFNTPSKTGFRISVEKPYEVSHYFGQKALSIRTGYTVRAVAFGLLKPSENNCSPEPFWKRLGKSKDLYFSTGHINGKLRVWDVITGKLLLELLDHYDMISHLSFFVDGSPYMLSASYDGMLKLWNLNDDGNMFKTMKMNGKPIYSCCWSPNGKMLVSVGMTQEAYLWDMDDFTLKSKLRGHHHDVIACAFSPDSCLIATASWDTRVILWNSYLGQMLKCFGHLHPFPHLIYVGGDNGNWIRSVAFANDGVHIATVADDGFVRFWDVTCEDNPKSAAAVDGALCCCFAPSGGILAVGSRDGTASFCRPAPYTVKSLLYLTRIAVRRIVSEDGVSDLPLPQQMIEFLKYKEWE